MSALPRVKTARPSRLLYFAPVVLLAHIIEEAPGLPAWINRRVDPDFTMGDFVVLNTVGFLVTVGLTVSTIRSRHRPYALGMIAWLSFLMLANGTLHIAASFRFGEYVPGTYTAAALYLPYFFAVTARISRDSVIRPASAILAAVIGAVPMVAHGVSIIMFGRPLLW